MEIVTVAAYRGAICRSCGNIIKKDENALLKSVYGASGGDRAFTCMSCVKKNRVSTHLRELAQEIDDILRD